MRQDAPVTVWTIGHSNRDLHHLIQLLRRHRIDVVVDVRSAPYSRYSPQFNRAGLEQAITEHTLRYEFLGQRLGGRPDNPQCYDPEGYVVYDRLEETADYRQGVDEVLTLAGAGSRVCLLCSEENPTVCHRALSIGHFLSDLGVRVEHIRGDGRIETQEDLRGKGLNEPTQATLFQDQPVRKSLQPIARRTTGEPGA